MENKNVKDIIAQTWDVDKLIQYNTVIFWLADYWEVMLKKAMAPHSSTLAWKIPWTAEPGGLQSMGSLRVGHNWVTSLSLFPFTHWRRKWRPTPVFLPRESQGRGSLVGFHLWGHRVRQDWSDSSSSSSSNHMCISSQQKERERTITMNDLAL